MRLPQSAGDLVRAHPLLEVSRARAGGFEAGPRESAGGPEPSSPSHHHPLSPNQARNLAQRRCYRHIRSPGRRQQSFLPSLEPSVELLPSLDLRGHLLRPLFSKGGNGGPERLGDLSRVAQHRGLRTPRDPLFPDRAVPISNPDLARLGKSGQRPCSLPRRGSPHVVSAASSLGPQESGGFLGWAGASWRVA